MQSLGLLIAVLALALASCDEAVPPHPPSLPGIEALRTCVSAGQPAFLFAKGPDVACLSGGDLATGTLSQVGYYFGGTRLVKQNGAYATVLQDFELKSGTYYIDLVNSSVTKIGSSVSGASQVVEGPEGNIIVIDFERKNLVDKMFVTYVGKNYNFTDTVKVDNISDMLPIDSSFDVENNIIAVLSISNARQSNILSIIDISNKSYSEIDVSNIERPVSIAYDSESNLLVLDAYSGDLYKTKIGTTELIGQLGPLFDQETLRVLNPIQNKGIFTFGTNDDRSQIYNVSSDGSYSVAYNIPQSTHYLTASPDGKRLCGREFPFEDSAGQEFYTDRIYSVDLESGMISYSVAELNRDTFDVPQFFCL